MGFSDRSNSINGNMVIIEVIFLDWFSFLKQVFVHSLKLEYLA